MRHTCLGAGLALCSLIAVAGMTSPAFALDKVRLGWCTSVITHGVAPIAVATKLRLVQAGGHRSRTGEFSGIFGLRPQRCDRRGAGRRRHLRTGRDPAADRREDAGFLHGLPPQHFWCRSAGGQPHQEICGSKGQENRGDLHGLGRRRAGPVGRLRCRSRPRSRHPRRRVGATGDKASSCSSARRSMPSASGTRNTR